jgi:hypothetical protein
LLGETLAFGAEAVGAAVAGILHNVAEAVVLVQALKEEVPESDEWSESAKIEAQRGGGGHPTHQEGGGQKFVEAAQELGVGELGAQEGWGFLGGRAGALSALGAAGFGFGFRVCHLYVYVIEYIHNDQTFSSHKPKTGKSTPGTLAGH